MKKHRPLDGVAMVPPGSVGPGGKVMQYEEGSDMMIEGRPEGGPLRRWPGIVSLTSLSIYPRGPAHTISNSPPFKPRAFPSPSNLVKS